jgi:hypothetical protein
MSRSNIAERYKKTTNSKVIIGKNLMIKGKGNEKKTTKLPNYKKLRDLFLKENPNFDFTLGLRMLRKQYDFCYCRGGIARKLLNVSRTRFNTIIIRNNITSVPRPGNLQKSVYILGEILSLREERLMKLKHEVCHGAPINYITDDIIYMMILTYIKEDKIFDSAKLSMKDIINLRMAEIRYKKNLY